MRSENEKISYSVVQSDYRFIKKEKENRDLVKSWIYTQHLFFLYSDRI